jgi:hypothetical protein
MDMLNGPKPGRWLVIVLLALTPVGCSDGTGLDRDPLAEARARWAQTNTANYVFELRRSCFCFPDFVRPVRIEVLDGVVNSAVYVDTEEALPIASVPTIDDLFDEIGEALEGTAFSVVADYDPDLGYPTSVSIDFIEFAIDDETAFTVSSFQLLDASGT